MLCLPSQRELWGAESLDIWLSLFISFIVSGCSRQQLCPAHIDPGPQTLTYVLLSFLSSPLPPNKMGIFSCTVWLCSPACQAWFVQLCGLTATAPPLHGPPKTPLNNPGVLRPWIDCPASCWMLSDASGGLQAMLYLALCPQTQQEAITTAN